MYFWEIDIELYVEHFTELKKESVYPHDCVKNEDLISLYKKHSAEMKQLIARVNNRNLTELLPVILSLDAKLYYILIELFIYDGSRTTNAILSELDNYYAEEYIVQSEDLPFAAKRLINAIGNK